MAFSFLWSLTNSSLLRPFTSALTFASQSLVVISFLLSVAHWLGWIHRLLWHLIEYHISKALNDTPVTIGSFRLDLLRGKVWASNVIVHSPKLQEWKWESPLVARAGSVYIETNLVWVLLRLLITGEEWPLEFYTIHAQDIQAFVERKQNVFNFFLMDPHLVFPDPVFDLNEEVSEDDKEDSFAIPSPAVTTSSNMGGENEEGNDHTTANLNNESSSSSQHGSVTASSPNNDPNGAVVEETAKPKEKAHELVDEMVRAVQSLGRAAQSGSGISRVLNQHRQNLKKNLEALKSKRKAQAMQEGLTFVQQVSKAVVEKTQNVQQIVEPTRKRLPSSDKDVYARFGRIVIEDARVFTPDHWEDQDGAYNKNGNRSVESNRSKKGSANENQSSSSQLPSFSSSPSSTAIWNKPIVLQQVIVRPAELCPAMSAKDADNENFPALYQTIDKTVDLLLKRLLTEIAKSNSGKQILRTAIGEALGYWREKDAGAPIITD